MTPIINVLKAVLSGACAVFVATTGAAAAPLFDSDDTLHIRIEAPIKELVRRAENDTSPYPGRLVISDDGVATYDINLSARGNSRRDTKVCDFPPLRVEFTTKPDDGLVFDGQKRLKLVTHCRAASRFQQYYLMEYTVYRLLNALTPHSLRVRLAEVEYFDVDSGKTEVVRSGFFIEDTDDAAKRNDVKEIDTPDIDITQVDPAAAGLVAVFQYMIGNLDWSVHDGPDGENCCHNMKLIGDKTEPFNGLIPVPYDFDYSGIVDTPYAVPPESLNVRNVKTRRYRGYCLHNEAALKAIDSVIEKRDAIYAEIERTPGIDDNYRRKARRFLDDFFEVVSDRDDIDKKMFRYCRG